MIITENFEIAQKFTDLMLTAYSSENIKGRSGVHRSSIIDCPLTLYYVETGEAEQHFDENNVGIWLLGELCHIAFTKYFDAREKVFNLAGIKVTIDAIYNSKFPVELKTCYDEQTEVLTIDGWKYFKDLTYNDKLLSMNPKTNDCIYVNPIEIIKNKYDGKLFKYKSKSLDIAVTLNHNMLVRKQFWNHSKELPLELIECNKLIGKNSWLSIPKQIKFIGNLNYNPPMNFKLEPWIQFLGWFISEGYIYKHDVCICQKNKTYHNDIEIILNNLNLKWTFSGDKYHIWNEQLAIYLKNNCYEGNEIRIKTKYCSYNKIVPKFIKELPLEYIKLFLDEFWKGDGSYNGYKPHQNRIFITSSKKLSDDLQELILKIGGSATIRNRLKKMQFFEGRIIDSKKPSYIITELRRNKNAWINFTKGKIESYKGNIYCAIVEPYHTLFVRRNGKAYWCGNTRKKIYKREDLLDDWIHQLSIGMAVMESDVGYLIVMNIITFKLQVYEFHTTKEEREKILEHSLWTIIDISNAIKKRNPNLLEPKYEKCKTCSFRPIKGVDKKNCLFYRRPN